VVGFDIGCHYNISTSNSICTTVVEVKQNIHDTVIMAYNDNQYQQHYILWNVNP